MPTYSFRDKNTQAEHDEFMSMSQLTAYLRKNKHIEQIIKQAPGIGDVILLGQKKPSGAFRERLQEVKHQHSQGVTKSTINTW